MGIKIDYTPVGAVGQMATLAGIGEWQKYQRDQAMKQAEFAQRQQQFQAENALAQRRQSFQEGQAAEDNRFRAINAFNEGRQDQINNAMRFQQQAEGAQRARAEFGMDQQRMALGARQQHDQSAFKWYDRATDAWTAAAGIQQRGYDADQGRQLQRDLFAGRQEGYDRRNDFLAEQQEQRLGAQEEMLRLRFNLQEEQDLKRLDQGIYRIRQGVMSGGLLPNAAQAQIGQMESQRQQIMTGARQRQQMGADENQAIQPMEIYQKTTYERPDGITFGFNRYGEPNVLHDKNKDFTTTYNAAFKALTKTTDVDGRKQTEYPKPDAIREYMLQQSQMQREIQAKMGAESAPSPTDVTDGPRQDMPQEHVRQQPPPEMLRPRSAAAMAHQYGQQETDFVHPEQRTAAFQELQRKREKLGDNPQMQRDVDWLERMMAQYPRLANAPPDVRMRVRALLKQLGDV